MTEDKKVNLERRLWERTSFRSREPVFMNMTEQELQHYVTLRNDYLLMQQETAGRRNHYVANVQAGTNSLLQEVEQSHEDFYDLMPLHIEVYRQLRAELNKK